MGAMKNIVTEAQDKAIEILRATNDGDDLTASELKLVENMVNGKLTLDRVESFNKLYSEKVAK